MKKLIIAILLIFGVFSTPLIAQEDATQENTIEVEDETTTLSEELNVSESNSDIGFSSILFATLTPTLLIVVAYLLIKMSKE